MSREAFDDQCEGCRPAMAKVDPETGKMAKIPDDDPMMVVINEVWAGTTLEERQAYHHVTCNNSRTPEDLRRFNDVCGRMKEKILAMKPD